MHIIIYNGNIIRNIIYLSTAIGIFCLVHCGLETLIAELISQALIKINIENLLLILHCLLHIMKLQQYKYLLGSLIILKMI